MSEMMLQSIGAASNPGVLRGLFQQEQVGDPFMLLLMNLLSSDEEEEAVSMLDALMMGRQDEDEPNEAAMELMAALLGAGVSPQQIAEVVENGDQMAGESAQVLALPELGTQTLETVRPEAEKAEPPLEKPEVSFDKVLTAQSVHTTEAKAEDLTEQLRFSTVVREVSETLKSQPKSQGDAEEIDVDKLQAEVTAGRFLQTTAARTESFQPLNELERQDVVEQLGTNILENLSLEKEAFVMQLKPEGLGEITVKLQEKDGKVIIGIQASDPQVAKALNQEVAALQNVLKPMQAEVHEIVHAAEYSANAQYDQNGERFDRGRNFSQQPNYGGTDRMEALDDVPTIQQVLAEEGLNTYI